MKTTTLLSSLALAHSLGIASAKASAGCGKTLPAGLTPGGPSQNLTLESESQINSTITRAFRTYLPEQFSANNDNAKPLILAFHGQLQPARSMETITNLSAPFFNREAVVVYPEGLFYQSVGGQQWLGDPAASPSSVVDDRIFAEELLDYVTSSFCIDEQRIYVTGLSNGGGLANLLACSPTLNRRIAAFATVAAAHYTDAALTEPLFGAGCDPQLQNGRYLPIMEMHGLNDSVIAYDGDNSPAPPTIPLGEWVNAWIDRERCGSMQTSTESLEGGNVTRSAMTCGRARDLVVHYAINNFGHGWPATLWQGQPFEQLRLGPTTWNATSVIVEWFNKWTLDASA
ncbi:alpha/beta-hydrolase [Byssothecium circinans]|uniref:feruloyl esterase n=1 Tax=Byssothecium circinans TaxID=147558 RepID=A0A6A5TY09_9PLEO|nr:alpha/beta-hydrolase [Byssothecium circinans]